ncbi:hypothetical protein ACFOPQ_01760 [Deinococcus antarcticus]|uniref:Uncharacterized protein n=1 Tax=Deinococcus antarcticus TaxID=1298767 RepID=A0ABV8A267_9DEIO|nr:hypothetical protein [Deinococcus cavernae]
MSPRFKRYLRLSLPRLLLLLLIIVALNALGSALKLGWLHLDLSLAVVVFLGVFFLNWLTRADPQRRD